MLSYNSMRICVLLLDKLLHVYIYPTFPMYSKSWEIKVFEIALLLGQRPEARYGLPPPPRGNFVDHDFL